VGQVKSFAAIATLFGDVPEHGMGKWFLLPEREILTQRNRQFSNKTGERPVVLERLSGPNAIVFPRSSSIPGGFRHGPHPHADTGCVINRHGWVVFESPCTVSSDGLSDANFSCYEPEDSLLMAELQKVRAA
jgi:hypothetical protein